MRSRARALAIVLVCTSFVGCLGSPREVASVDLPAGVAEVLEAARRGEVPRLDAVLAFSENARGIRAAVVPPGTLAAPSGELAGLFAASGVAVDPATAASLAAFDALPSDLATAIATLARASLDARRLAAEALAEDGASDWAMLFQAARTQASAADATRATLARYSGAFETAPALDTCGVAAIDLASQANTYACDYALQIDLGGADVYANNAGGTFLLKSNALAIDVAGDDRYVARYADHVGVAGGAMMGVGMLVDWAGNDHYNVSVGEGGAVNGAADALGVGFFADMAGDDTIVGRAGFHAAANGGGWTGAGHMLLVGGMDVVDGSTEGVGGVNGGAFGAGTGVLVGIGGSRTYRAHDPSGGGVNGGAHRGGSGLLVDDGDATRYEAHAAAPAGANGGANGGRGLLVDLGGGDDVYVALGDAIAATNGGSLSGQALLFDDGGSDLYSEDSGATFVTDSTLTPKGYGGAQVDAPGGSRAPASPLTLGVWPPAARPVARALLAADGADYGLLSVHDVLLAGAGAPSPSLPAATTTLARAYGDFLATRGAEASPRDLAALARVPPDLALATADLLATFTSAQRDVAAAYARLDRDAPAPPGAYAAQRALLAALARTAPTFTRYAGTPVLDERVGLCNLASLDFTAADASYACDYAFQITLGGESEYRNRAGATLAYGGVAFLLDAGGDDRYVGPDTEPKGVPVAGSAAGGLGFLVDLAGNDAYAPRCERGCVANGGATGGVGTLVDFAGDDHYMIDGPGYNVGNGASVLGGAFLADLAGDDHYDARSIGNAALNGASFLGGAALLFDRDGDDRYNGVATHEHTVINGASTSGFAMILDLAGDDEYWGESGHHGITNGGGFFAAPGSFLIDAAGDDRYVGASPMAPTTNGRYYIVGKCRTSYGCAQGMSALVDVAGSDAYVEWQTMPAGAGHAHGAAHAHGAEEARPASCTPPEGHDSHSHEHACAEEPMVCAPPDGHEAHTHAHPCASKAPQPMPEPEMDETVFPKGDLGAQLDLANAPLLADLFRAFAGISV